MRQRCENLLRLPKAPLLVEVQLLRTHQMLRVAPDTMRTMASRRRVM